MSTAKDQLFKKIFLALLFIAITINLNAQTVRINEFVSSNNVTLDEDGDTPDWLEIHNYGNQEVSLNGWALSDDADDLGQWKFPNITLSPNGYMLIWASSKNKTEVKTPKTLINQGDVFKYIIPTSEPNNNWKTLNFNDTNWVTGNSGFGYDDGDDATIIPNGTKSIFLRKKFNINNLATITSLILDIDYDDAFVAYINGTEIARANILGAPPAYNSGTITYREANMYQGGQPERFVITDFKSLLNDGENVLSIQAHNVDSNSSDFTIIPFLSAIFTKQNNLGVTPPAILGLSKNHFHTNFKISSRSETIYLTNSRGNIVHQLGAENLPKNTSTGISNTSDKQVSYIETTPGARNSNQEYLGSVQNEIVFSEESGLITEPINLVLTGNTAGQQIRYTLNGSVPSANSLLYTNPIQINRTTTVNAQIFATNYIPSPVATRSYITDNSNIPFTDSNLPIVMITTDNLQEIRDDYGVYGNMKVIQRPNGARNFVSDANNEDYLNYSGAIRIEIRGSSSQQLDKKPYGFTTLSDDKSDNNNVELLGMPKENDWILNSFAFDDSMMRDYISYEMARKMGQYAVNLKYCEVVVNGDYKGLYALSEKIKIDGDRVDIAKISEEDNSFPSVTGGYLVQTDRATAANPQVWYNDGAAYIVEKPNAAEITPTQSSYIESVFRNFDATASNANITNGYPSIIDVPSFTDYILMAEIVSNADAYAFSTFYHKDRGGKLRAGPIWDYNLTYGNDLFQWGLDRSFTNVWQFQFSNVGAYFWRTLFLEQTFNCYLAKRFNELIQSGEAFNNQYISNLIDETAILISEAVVRENQRWSTIPNFSREVANMKSWLQQRITWMNNNLRNFSNCSSIQTPSLVITKIDYHPQETAAFPESDNLEFIEITNTGNTTVNLTGIYLMKLGVSYQFPANSSILPKQSIHLAANATSFESKYGIPPFDTFERNLSNKNQHLVLADAFGNTIDEVNYFDKDPWPEAADGNGFYLELTDFNADNSLASNWKASANLVLNTTDFNVKTTFRVYPNPAKDVLKINADKVIKTIEVFTLLGRKVKVFKADFSVGEINISDLKQGAYFLNLKLTDGGNLSKTIFKK